MIVEALTLAALLAEHDVLTEAQRDAEQERILLFARVELGDREAKPLLLRNANRIRALKRLALTFARRVARETAA